MNKKTAEEFAIEAILEAKCDHHIEHSQVTFLHNHKADGNTLKQLCDAIELKIIQYAAQFKSEWVPVRERLPEESDGEVILIFDAIDNVPYGTMYKKLEEWERNGVKVTHWKRITPPTK